MRNGISLDCCIRMPELWGVKNNVPDIIASKLLILWVYAAASKLLDYDAFGDSLYKQPLPLWAASLLAWMLPLELLYQSKIIIENIMRIKGRKPKTLHRVGNIQ